MACRPGRAQTKGKVESPFNYVEKNLLGAREFYDLYDLRAKARWWMKEKSDRHRHDTTGRPPLELFLEQEQSALQPLPRHPYDTGQVALRICSLDGFLEFETNRYSVPLEYVADILTLKAGEEEIIDLQSGNQTDRLPRAFAFRRRPGRRASGTSPEQEKFGMDWSRSGNRFWPWAFAAELFLEGLKGKYPRNCGFHARYILLLREHYHAQDLNAAMAHANRYQAFDGKAVERILKARAKPRTLEAIRIESAQKTLSQALPRIKQRSLDEYGHFLSDEDPDDEN